MNVTIQWSKGAPPVLSIYNETGHTTNTIDLAQYDDKERLDALMIEEGFRKMTQEEREEWQEKKKERNQKDVEMAERNRKKRLEQRAKRAEKEGGDPNVVRVLNKKPLVEGDNKEPPKQSTGDEL